MTNSIKPVNEAGTKILNSIFSLCEKDAEQAVKIDNTSGLFMPLCAEIIVYTKKAAHLSLCHYGEQNGDLMRDPEMVFLKMENYFYPFYWRNDYVGIENEALQIENIAQIAGINKPMYNSFLEFADLWLNNIKEQQGL